LQLEKERKAREEREKRDAEEAAERQQREEEWVRENHWQVNCACVFCQQWPANEQKLSSAAFSKFSTFIYVTTALESR